MLSRKRPRPQAAESDPEGEPCAKGSESRSKRHPRKCGQMRDRLAERGYAVPNEEGGIAEREGGCGFV